MANNYAFKSQIASIMEVLANTAVAEICKLIDNDYAVLRLEISQNQNENRMLKRKVQMMELKMARDRAERTIRDCLPNARSRGRTSVMDRNKGWRGGGHFVSRDRLLANQGESSWRGRRWLTDTPSKRTVGVQEPTVTELEGPVILIKEEVPEAVMPETAGTSWKRVVGPACDGMVLPTVTAEPLGSAAAAATGQHGSGHNVVEAVNADIGLPMNSMDEDQERQTDATSSFLLPGFKESDLAANDPLSTLGQTRELPMSSPVEHTVFSSAVKKESEEASSCSGLNRPSTSEGQWPAPVDVDWTANLASGQTQDHGSTSDTLESSDMFSMENHQRTDAQVLGVYSLDRTSNFPSGSMFPVPDRNQQCFSRKLRNRTISVDLHSSDTSDIPVLACTPQNNKPKKKRVRDKKLTCPICGKGIRYPVEMKIHLRVHTGEKPYACSLCEKSFTVACDLKTHMRGHTGEKPFSCSRCDKKFAARRYVRKHLRRVHGQTES
ncbi:uncharacterized protein LOC134465189 isoform X2 [Engraulis encrasicolus]|uniref:uncharacterized protein LOC134465189 isoform X2 n=1 Tax=Engraulis encrasicolus TaxID=184585 RepID=UPI002FCEB465